jgi:hypothetical protein
MTESREQTKLTESQSAILSYWKSVTPEGRLPKRGDLDPGAIVRYLGGVSILELSETGQVNSRVTGSRLGHAFPGEALATLYALGLTALLEAAKPVRGVRNTKRGIHHWLRLPMVSDCGARLLILCYDEVLPVRQNRGQEGTPSERLSTQFERLAA